MKDTGSSDSIKPKINRQEAVLLPLILLLTFLIRIPFLAEPLECDQGVFSYIAWSWQEGKIPYKDLFDAKPPVIYLFIRFIFYFLGNSVVKLHMAYAVLAVFATLFFYLLSREFFSRRIALLSAFLYGLFSGGALISGSFANTDNVMVFFIILAFYIFWKAYQRNNNFVFLIAGIFIGLAAMSKQSAFWEAMAMSIFLFWAGRHRLKLALNLKRIVFIWIGASSVVILFWVYFIFKKAGREFFYSVFIFNIFFSRIVGIRQGLVNLWNALFCSPRENFLLWITACLGFYRAILRKEAKSIFMMLWFAAALLGVFSAWRFFPHYFIQIMPVLVILSCYYLNGIFHDQVSLWKKYLAAVILVLAMVIFLKVQWNYYFKYSPVDSLIYRRGGLSRASLCNAVNQVSALLKKNTLPNDSIYIWGLWPELYFYAQRHTSSKYFFIPGKGSLLGGFANSVQRQVLADTLRNKPKYFIIDGHFKDLISVPLDKYLKEYYYLDREIAGSQVLRRKEQKEENI